MLLSIEGEEATGKTTFAYSAPLPIVGFAWDMGIERALYGGRYTELFDGLRINTVPYKDGKPTTVFDNMDITIFELPAPIQLDSIRVRGCIALWNYFLVTCVKALTDPTIKSVVVDTMTVARRVKANAYLEELQDACEKQNKPMREQLLQIEYGKPNDAIRDIYNTGAGVKKNLIATHHLTDEYRSAPTGRDGKIESSPTGKRVLEGLTGTYRFVDVAVRMAKAGKDLTGELLKCGYDLSLEGMRLEGPTWDSVVNLVAMKTDDRIRIERRNNED